MNDQYPPPICFDPLTGLTCKDVLNVLMAYIDGELPADQVAAFEEHLALCSSCVNYLASYRKSVRLARIAMAEPPALTLDAMPNDLLRAILNASRRVA